MKLYIHQAACSLSPHIVARELGLDVEIIHVERATHRTSDGQDFLAINPNGYVPVLVLDDGEIVIEGPAIVQYLADLKPEGGLAPQTALERRKIQSLLNFISTEIHKPMGQMFAPAYAPVKEVLHKHVAARLDWAASRLEDGHLTGGALSVADIYLFVCLNWSQWLGIELSRWPQLEAFMKGIGARPGVLEALKAEGLHPRSNGIFFAPRLAA
ncbi:glutathione S-transferase N-terminal domain-containing protein [Aminobacter aminovorans]|uniref:glutathione S-transferase N-terminal domain-containing protein n=1 Tax=Aminobacter aminovorans TaxID=83263 RepID=UPI00285FE644|nr:glutathione S-transferase N-terminal domain-containing protein [Aminobacter aminovorans]MDR7219688.1 glutathione S-transferase [Aminobacter aminovorans]